MKHRFSFLFVFVSVLIAAVSCESNAVMTPGLRSSSQVDRTTAEGVRDTIWLSDSLNVGDTARLGIVGNGYYNYLTSFVASADTSCVRVSLAWSDEYKDSLSEDADPANGILKFQPEKVYAFMTTLQYIPKKSGTHKIALDIQSSAASPYSSMQAYFMIAVK